MKKSLNFFKTTSICLLLFTILTPISSYALEKNIDDENVKPISTINIENEDQMERFVEELEENNNKANEKWQEILDKADYVSPVLQINNNRTPKLSSSYSVNVPIDRHFGSFLSNFYFSGWLNLRANVFNDSGTMKFYDYTGVYFISKDPGNTIQDMTYQVARYDGSRTFVVRLDCFITVRGSTTSQTFPLSLVVEFTANGGYYVY